MKKLYTFSGYEDLSVRYILNLMPEAYDRKYLAFLLFQTSTGSLILSYLRETCNAISHQSIENIHV